jgi:hypothetical protein
MMTRATETNNKPIVPVRPAWTFGLIINGVYTPKKEVLNYDIYELIISFCDIWTKGRMLTVCKDFNEIIENEFKTKNEIYHKIKEQETKIKDIINKSGYSDVPHDIRIIRGPTATTRTEIRTSSNKITAYFSNYKMFYELNITLANIKIKTSKLENIIEKHLNQLPIEEKTLYALIDRPKIGGSYKNDFKVDFNYYLNKKSFKWFRL